MRTIAVATVGRSDYGIYRPVLRRLRAHPDVNLRLIVLGMHLIPAFGTTIREIDDDGFTVDARVDHLLASDTAVGVTKSMGLATIGMADALSRLQPDLLVVLGDRAEMHAAAVAAVPFGIPLAHVHGGEITEGAIDDAFRHSITKLSHLHFVSTDAYAARVCQMGEEPWRVVVSGAPALDNVSEVPRLTAADLEARIGMPLTPAPLLVTFHPVTLESSDADVQLDELMTALSAVDRPVVFTMPNADAGGQTIARRLEAFVAATPHARLVANLGTVAYFSLMAKAAAMVGNSSSGLIEAPSFGLPVVNIGARQRGRVRGANVIDVEPTHVAILDGIRRALDPAFRQQLVGQPNPYGDGGAAERIVSRLVSQPLDSRLMTKRFVDVP